ncbi:hypothetical protein CO2235_30019 [Cupriavidus oxalaticus]|uniref:Uncharacterized protein n=1 Tax=Cupriavidus oxalaticus TaxID=96344 RepID=A0A375GCD9_9BURK|nr:hypothetical protein CO2235_30019 [Cupriavidus oxalaticus]
MSHVISPFCKGPAAACAYDPDVAFVCGQPANLPLHTANARSLSQKRTVVQIILAQQSTIKLLIRPVFLNGPQCSMPVTQGDATARKPCVAAWQQTHSGNRFSSAPRRRR